MIRIIHFIFLYLFLFIYFPYYIEGAVYQPSHDGKRLDIHTGYYISNIVNVDDEKETLTIEGILYMKWHDIRNAFDADEVGVKEKVFQGIYQVHEVYEGWWPEVYLVNESDGFNVKGYMVKVMADGTTTFILEMISTTKSILDLEKIPFDQHDFDLKFEVLGYDQTKVNLIADKDLSGYHLEQGTTLNEWKFMGINVTDQSNKIVSLSNVDKGSQSTFVVSIHLKRESFFLIRIVILPLILLVVLSWMVFWMDRESLGDRMDLSFMAILSIVAYQIMVSEHMPQISYFTLISTFIYINYFVLFLCVIENLIVSSYDKVGKTEIGNKVDTRSRWFIPLLYLSLNIISLLYYF